MTAPIVGATKIEHIEAALASTELTLSVEEIAQLEQPYEPHPVRNEGRQRLYRLNGRALKPIHDWVKKYERSWSERFDQLDAVLEDLEQKEEGDANDE